MNFDTYNNTIVTDLNDVLLTLETSAHPKLTKEDEIVNDNLRECTVCNEFKPSTEFYGKNKRCCKKCHRESILLKRKQTNYESKGSAYLAKKYLKRYELSYKTTIRTLSELESSPVISIEEYKAKGYNSQIASRKYQKQIQRIENLRNKITKIRLNFIENLEILGIDIFDLYHKNK